MKWIVLVAAAVLFFTPAAQSRSRFWNAGIDKDQAVYNAFHQLQTAVARGDRKSAARLMEYPLNVDWAKPGARKFHSVEIQSQSEFIRKYRWIMTPKLQAIILKSKPSDLWSSWRGVAVGQGDVWFEQLINSPKIKIRSLFRE